MTGARKNVSKSVKRSRLITMQQAQKVLRRSIDTSGLSQSAYAKKIGDSGEAVSLVVNGRRGLSRAQMRALKLQRVIAYQPRG
jgi:antitoxin component HigA of HigAB toxin-antitoxin module